jgi:uncharacterized protein YcbX/ferredoxin-NADP reductase
MYLSEIRIHPLKSAAPLRVSTARVLADGLDGDRRLMLSDTAGVVVTARQHPRLLAVRCVVDAAEIILAAPGMPTIAVPLPNGGRSTAVTIWDDQVALERIPAADRWLCDYLGAPVQLMAMSEETRRPVRDVAGSSLNLADAAPLMLMGASSLSDLAARVPFPTSMDRFRPNLVVADAMAYAEDSWSTIRIGGVTFDLIAPCDRCNMVLLDPDDPEKPARAEPLSTLAQYRRDAKGLTYLGQLLVPRTLGRINIGDPIEVLARKDPPAFMPSRSTAVAPMSPVAVPSAPKAGWPLKLRCVARIAETREITSFLFQSGDGAPLPDYAAGQVVVLEVPIDGVPHRRCYTLSSSPSRTGTLAITVRRGPLVSATLHDRLQVADTVVALGIGGKFQLHPRPTRNLLFLSAGSGITPFLSMLRWMADHAWPVQVLLHHSARLPNDVVAADELRLLERQANGRLRVDLRLTRAGAPRFRADMLADLCPDIGERLIFACGPATFLDEVRAGAAALEGFDPANLRIESFVTAGDESAEELPRPYRVRFMRSDLTVKGEGAPTLLKLARDAGITLETACQVGLCGTCRVKVTAGAWTLSAHCADPDRSILTAAEQAAGIVLACTTRPDGDMEIDL